MGLNVLRYFGSKNKLGHRIMRYFPPHTTYVEPYGGSASVLLNKPPSTLEIYNDLDGQVVNLFRVLRDPDQAERLIRLVELTPCRGRGWSGKQAGRRRIATTQ